MEIITQNVDSMLCTEHLAKLMLLYTKRLNLLFVFFQSVFIDSSCQGQVRYFVLSGKKKDSSHTGNNSKPTENKISWKQITCKYQKILFYYFFCSKIRPRNFTPIVNRETVTINCCNLQILKFTHKKRKDFFLWPFLFFVFVGENAKGEGMKTKLSPLNPCSFFSHTTSS